MYTHRREHKELDKINQKYFKSVTEAEEFLEKIRGCGDLWFIYKKVEKITFIIIIKNLIFKT